MTQVITLLGAILMVTAEFSLQKQMEICMFNFMHLSFTIVLLAFPLRIQSNKIKGLSQGPFIFISQFTFTKPSFTITPLILNTYFLFAFNVALKVPFFRFTDLF